MTIEIKSVPSVSVSYAGNGSSTKANALGMRPMQERAYERRGEQYLLIKSPPASGKSRALMFIALDNPIYYGDFNWKGTLYNGTHEPIISKDLFDKVQKALARRSSCPTGRQKHDFLFQGMLTCGHCGCAVVAELHKGKYIYYRCTHNQGKCPDKYVREERIDEQFTKSLEQIRIDDDVLDWIVSVMGASTAESMKQRAVQVTALTQQKQRLEDRLEKMYLDKLDGVLSEEEYARLSKKFRSEATDLKFKLEQMEGKNKVNIDSGKRLLELAQKAASLYSTQIPAEKRKLLNTLYSNSTWAGGELAPNFRKPFDMIVVSNQAYKREKAIFPEKNDLFEKWRPKDNEIEYWEMTLNIGT